MVSVPISELKAHAERYVTQVEAGEEVIVTRGGRPVARISAIEEQREGVPERWKELERRGLARIRTGKLPSEWWTLPRPEVKGNAAVEALLADREEGW